MKTQVSRLFDVSGKAVLITGAGGQLGGEYVSAFLEAGAYVAALDKNVHNPRGKLSSISSENVFIAAVDITDKNSIRTALDACVSRFGVPSVLVNNAALDAPPNATDQDTGPFEQYPEDSWDQMMNVNVKGTFLMCQAVGGLMASHNGGSIINIASIYGMLSPDQRLYEHKKPPFTKPIAYSVSKSAIYNLTRYLATYWANKKVRVNTLTLAGVFNNQDDAFLKKYTAKVPLGRMANQNEYNGAVLFLASDASAYMTGANMVIDGGYSCW
ncbi:SDR family oxidoreductase [bacterium]|nr:SDR family oxidoreductase [bacterium]MCP5462045.1 SDR family oxidoreductase [bacterium]